MPAKDQAAVWHIVCSCVICHGDHRAFMPSQICARCLLIISRACCGCPWTAARQRVWVHNIGRGMCAGLLQVSGMGAGEQLQVRDDVEFSIISDPTPDAPKRVVAARCHLQTRVWVLGLRVKG